jgi:hypothetical protein
MVPRATALRSVLSSEPSSRAMTGKELLILTKYRKASASNLHFVCTINLAHMPVSLQKVPCQLHKCDIFGGHEIGMIPDRCETGSAYCRYWRSATTSSRSPARTALSASPNGTGSGSGPRVVPAAAVAGSRWCRFSKLIDPCQRVCHCVAAGAPRSKETKPPKGGFLVHEPRKQNRGRANARQGAKLLTVLGNY